MDKTALVEADLEVGREIVEALERSGIPIDLAAWLQDERVDVLASFKAARVDK
jgi:hypothetical protein